MKNKLIALIALQIALPILLIVGYVKCVVKLCQCDFEPSHKAEVIYSVGTLTGLGCIVGYIDCGK